MIKPVSSHTPPPISSAAFPPPPSPPPKTSWGIKSAINYGIETFKKGSALKRTGMVGLLAVGLVATSLLSPVLFLALGSAAFGYGAARFSMGFEGPRNLVHRVNTAVDKSFGRSKPTDSEGTYSPSSKEKSFIENRIEEIQSSIDRLERHQSVLLGKNKESLTAEEQRNDAEIMAENEESLSHLYRELTLAKKELATTPRPKPDFETTQLSEEDEQRYTELFAPNQSTFNDVEEGVEMGRLMPKISKNLSTSEKIINEIDTFEGILKDLEVALDNIDFKNPNTLSDRILIEKEIYLLNQAIDVFKLFNQPEPEISSKITELNKRLGQIWNELEDVQDQSTISNLDDESKTLEKLVKLANDFLSITKQKDILENSKRALNDITEELKDFSVSSHAPFAQLQQEAEHRVQNEQAKYDDLLNKL